MSALNLVTKSLKPFLLGCFCLFCLTGGFSKSALGPGEDGHNDDYLKVLGLYAEADPAATAANFYRLKPLFDLYARLVDGRTGENREFYALIQQEFPGFSYGGNNDYGHRLLFHWGFESGDPKNHAALKTQFFLRTHYADEQQQAEEFSRFIALVANEQHRRYGIFTAAVDSFFHLGGDRELSRGIAGILYYTHLLGDHIEHTKNHTKTVEAVLPLEVITIHLERYVRDIAKNTARPLFDSCAAALKAAAPITPGEEKAQAILNVLFDYVPQILRTNLQNTYGDLDLVFQDGVQIFQ